MTIDEAINILYRWRNGDYQIYDDVLQKALALGIEALKRIKEVRYDHRLIMWLKLPGETPAETEASHET